MGEVQNFTLFNQQGEKINFYDALSNTSKGIVIFCYPKASTPGCNKQACGFRDHYDEIKENGYEVLGLSKDKQAAQASWKKGKNLPYDLLCDEDGDVLKQLGCISGNSTTRSVFVVDKESRSFILNRIKISPEDSVNAVIEIVKGVQESGEEASDEKLADEEEMKENVEEPTKKVSKPKAKPKAKAKASASRSRPPLEKKESEEEAPVEKKISASKRTAAQRSTSADVAMLDKKRISPPVPAPASKKSVKRSEPSGGVDEPDSPKGAKRSKRIGSTASSSEDEQQQPAAIGRPKSTPRSTVPDIVPPLRTSTRLTRKGAAEQATKKVPKEKVEEVKVTARKAPASGSTSARSASTGAGPRRGKRVA